MAEAALSRKYRAAGATVAPFAPSNRAKGAAAPSNSPPCTIPTKTATLMEPASVESQTSRSSPSGSEIVLNKFKDAVVRKLRA